MSPLQLRLEPDTSELRTMRSRLREHLRRLDEPADDWLVIATELATNSIDVSTADQPIELDLIPGHDRLCLRVTDRGPGYDPGSESQRCPSPASARGRGLLIVRAMADRLHVERTEGRTTTIVERGRTPRIDVAVIGLGSAGEATAAALARTGRSVVGFEPSRVGGECPFIACMPSKSMLVDAHRARAIDDPADLWAAAVERRREIVDDLDDSSHARELSEAGVELVRSSASLAGDRAVIADGRTWYAEHIVLATGSSPVVPDIPGLERERVWTAFDALTAAERPDRVLVMGAGAVGCELADVYSSFGSAVTVVDVADRMLPDHDAEVADQFVHALRSLGIEVRLGVGVELIHHGPGTSTADLSNGEQIEVDQIIVATGQAPRLDGLRLDAVGLEAGDIPELGPHRNVLGHEGLWMIGDLNGRTPWTHGANRDADIVTGAITGTPWSQTSSAMPHAVFTDPPAAHVGTAADEHNRHLRGVGRHSDIARLITDELDDGLVVIAVDRDSGTIVGCSAVGTLADEIIATATTFVQFGITVADARTQVFAFPTVSQVLEVAIADAAEQWERSRTT